jgi:hypothetical protein
MYYTLIALFAILLYLYGAFYLFQNKNTTQEDWMALDTVVQGMGVFYAIHCFVNKKCIYLGFILLFLAAVTIYLYYIQFSTTDKRWLIQNGSTVAIWAYILIIQLKHK